MWKCDVRYIDRIVAIITIHRIIRNRVTGIFYFSFLFPTYSGYFQKVYENQAIQNTSVHSWYHFRCNRRQWIREKTHRIYIRSIFRRTMCSKIVWLANGMTFFQWLYYWGKWKWTGKKKESCLTWCFSILRVKNFLLIYPRVLSQYTVHVTGTHKQFF